MNPGAQSDRDDRRPNPDFMICVGIFVTLLSVYLVFLTTHYSYDSVAGGVLLYQWLASGSIEQLFHRYHILYLPFAAGVDLGLSSIGLEIDPLTLLQVLNALFAAAAATLFYRLSRALELGRWLSSAITVLFAGGFGFWYYATNGESYPISLFFLLLAFLSAIHIPVDASWRRNCRPGVWLGLAAGFHGTCILALPALAFIIWMPELQPRNWRRAITAVLAVVVVLGLPYAGNYLLLQQTDPLSGAGSDISAFASEPGWSIGLGNMFRQWLALGTTLTPSDWEATPSSFPIVAKTVSWVGLLATLLPLALLIGVDRRRRTTVLAVTLWLGACFVFFSTYFAGSPKFVTYQWAPLLLLVGIAVQHTARPAIRPAATALLCALALATVLCNFGLVRRQADESTNPHLQRAIAIARHTQPEDLIVHLGQGENQHQKVYTPYFAVRPSLVLESYFDSSPSNRRETIDALSSRLSAGGSGSGRVVVMADAAELGMASLEFEKDHALPQGSLARFFAAYDPEILVSDPAAGRLWVLERAPSQERLVSPAVFGGD